MKFFRDKLHSIEPLFLKGGKYEKFFPLYEAADTFLFSNQKKTEQGPHVRDALDTKRMMTIVILALLPCVFMGIYNAGYQILKAQNADMDFWSCIWLGAWHVVPIIAISYIAGGFWEMLFAIVRRHEINEGFLVTGLLFPLTLPPTLPLWMVAVGISFGVVIGKEVFGGTGMNILNPALTARAFVFFAFPVCMSGDKVWTALDGHTGATVLGLAASKPGSVNIIESLRESGFHFDDAVLGTIPGSIGETSLLACMIGAAILIVTRIGSWRTMLGCFGGASFMALLIRFMADETTSGITHLPLHWHIAVGGFAFGTVYMATDPVTSAATDIGRWIYGALIGMLAILIRTVNPAFPEGMMLAILFMNVFAPLIDHFVVRANVARRLKRA